MSPNLEAVLAEASEAGRSVFPADAHTNLTGNGTLVLVTDTGSRIIWGSAPGQETPLEALWERKLVRLDHLFSASGRVDQHHSGEIDLTDASVVVRR